MRIKTLSDLLEELKITFPATVSFKEQSQFYHGGKAGEQKIILFIQNYRDNLIRKDKARSS